jgi:hypothetical protein
VVNAEPGEAGAEAAELVARVRGAAREPCRHRRRLGYGSGAAAGRQRGAAQALQ